MATCVCVRVCICVWCVCMRMCVYQGLVDVEALQTLVANEALFMRYVRTSVGVYVFVMY